MDQPIYLRGTIWWIRYSFAGKQYRESSHSTKFRVAERLLKQRYGEIGGGVLIGPRAERVTFADLERFVLDDYKARKLRSLARLKVAMTHLREVFGASRALSITTDRMTQYVVARQESGAAQATIQYELAALGRGFRLAAEAKHLGVIPAVPFLGEPDNARRGFFDPGDLAALLLELPEYLVPVVRFGYLTGWRIRSEVLTRRWNDHVDFEAGEIRLLKGETKNGKPRTFPFAALPDLAMLLQEQRARTPQEVPWVFHRHGKPIRDYYGAWRSACRRAGLEGMIAHDLRRTAVRNLIRAEVTEKVAMELTGHLTTEVFRRYNITDERDRRLAVAKLAQHLDETSTKLAQSGVAGLSGQG